MKERTSVALDAQVRRGLVREAKRKNTSVSRILNELAGAHLARERAEGRSRYLLEPMPMPKGARRPVDAVRDLDRYAYDEDGA